MTWVILVGAVVIGAVICGFFIFRGDNYISEEPIQRIKYDWEDEI